MQPPDLYDVDRLDDPRGRVVRPRGELGAEASDELRATLHAALAAERVPLVLDLSEVTFMDSTALSIVLAGLREAWGRGQALLVAGPLQPTIASLLSITGVDRFVTVHPSREEALGALAG